MSSLDANLRTLARWAAQKDRVEGGVANGAAIACMLATMARARRDATAEQLAQLRLVPDEIQSQAGPFEPREATRRVEEIMGWS